MGIGEKKSVLRGMYQNPAAPDPQTPAAPPPPPAVARSERLEARLDRLIFHFLHAGIYLLFLIGLAAIAAILYSHYTAGLALAPAYRFTTYFKDGVYACGISLLLILLGVALFAFFRDKLPRRARWVAFAAILSLFPIAIAAICFFSTCFQAGRDVAFSRLDHAQLLADSRSIAALFPLTDNTPAELDLTIFSLPSYTRDTLHPSIIRVFPHGILIVTDSTFSDIEGVILYTSPLSPSAAQSIADRDSLKLLSAAPPIFRFYSIPDTHFLEDPARPSTLPSYFSGGYR